MHPQLKIEGEYEENLKQENEMLKKKFEHAGDQLKEERKKIKEVLEDKKRLETVHEKDKDKIKELENQIASFRSELLTGKHDKNKISQKNKALEEELSSIKDDRNKVKEENIVLKEKVTEMPGL